MTAKRPAALAAASVALLAVFAVSACGAPDAPAASDAADPSETLFVEGVVWTADPTNPRAEAVLVRDGVIDFVGTSAQASERAGPGAPTVELAGRMLLPGFVESHTHPAVAGLIASTFQVIGTESVAQVQAALADYAAANPDEDVLFGFGFPGALASAVNSAGVTGPHKEDLDAVVSDRPVMILAVDAHSAWLNSRALEVAGIDRDTPDPVPGVHFYQRDASGEPTGWAVEGAAFWPLLPVFGIGSEEEFRAALSATLPALSSMGVTTVYDAGIPGGETTLRNALSAAAALEREGQLSVRYQASWYVDSPNQEPAEVVAKVNALQGEFASDLLDVRTVKIALDGTIEGQTAAVLEPYASGRGGAVALSGDYLAGLLTALREAGLHAHAHAIGDRTLRMVLDAVAAARQSVPRSGSRLAVAHAMLAADEDLTRLGALDVSIQTTPHWAHDMQGSLDLYSRLLDPGRGARIMRLRAMWDAAPLVAFGADFPATGLPFELASPLYGIKIGVTRLGPGVLEGPPYPPADQRLALDEMLRGYTTNGARQLGMEETTGAIRPGWAADLVVVDRDLFGVEPAEIDRAQVDMTMLGGRIVFAREGAAQSATATVPGSGRLASRESQQGAALHGGLHPEAEEAISKLRSPFCPGLMLEVCPTANADALRDSIDADARDGAGADSLVEMVVAAYGEEYRAFPKRQGAGLLAWVVPPAGLLAGLGLVVLALRRLRGSVGSGPDAAEAADRLTSEEEARLNAALAEFDAMEEAEA